MSVNFFVAKKGCETAQKTDQFRVSVRKSCNHYPGRKHVCANTHGDFCPETHKIRPQHRIKTFTFDPFDSHINSQ